MSRRACGMLRRFVGKKKIGRRNSKVLPFGKVAVCVFCASVLTATSAEALPNGADVISGKIVISTPTSAEMLVRQSTNKAIINWSSFSINRNELVKFNQPSSSAVVLNRVVGNSVSSILGKLEANGRVFLINPNGIVFGKTAVVDTAGLVASTLNISDEDFLEGKYDFSQISGKDLSYIINNGKIEISDNGFVYLIAPSAANRGLIVAKLGSVVMASGTSYTVDFSGTGLITYAVPGKVEGKVIGPNGNIIPSGVSNEGKIQATGGEVLLTVRAAQSVLSSVVNNTGIVQAQSVVKKGGKIILEGGDGNVNNSGTLDVSSSVGSAQPGTVKITGKAVRNSGAILANGTDNSDAGSIIIKSQNLTVLSNSSDIEADGRGKNSRGGFVEVSSGETVKLGGILRAFSQSGRPGEILVDPENLEITNDEYSNGSNLDYEADNSIKVDPGVVISTRDTDEYGDSVGDSGSLTMEAPEITIGDGAALLTYASNGYKSGDITLNASNSGGYSDSSVSSSINISKGAILHGGNIDIEATSTHEATFGSGDSVKSVSLSFLGDNPISPGGYSSTAPSSSITVAGGATVEGSTINIQSTSKATSETLVLLTGANVAYGKTEPKAKITIDGAIKSTGKVSINSESDETLDVYAYTLTLSRSKSAKVDISVAYGRSDLQSAVDIGSTATLEGSSVEIKSYGDKSVSISTGGLAYENGTVGTGIAVSESTDKVETSVEGRVVSSSGDTSVLSELVSEEDKANSSASAGGKNLIKSGLIKVKGAISSLKTNFSFKNVPLSKRSSLKKLGISASFTYLKNESTVKSYVDGGGLSSSGSATIEANLKYTEGSTNGIQSSAVASVDTNDVDVKEDAVAGALDITNSSDDVEAYVDNGYVKANNDVNIHSSISMPYEITWQKIHGVSDVLNKLNGNLGIQSGFFTTWAQSNSSGSQVGVAGSVNITEFSETSKAYVGSKSEIDGNRVSVLADNDIETANFGGNIGLGVGNSGKSSVGGTYLGVYYTNDTEATIEGDTNITADTLDVKANSITNDVSIGVSGGKSKSYGVNGTFSYLSVNNTTKSEISPGSSITDGAGKSEAVDVEANNPSTLINLAGGIAGSSSTGIGASVGITKVSRDTESTFGGRVSVNKSLTVSAGDSGLIGTWTLAGSLAVSNNFDKTDALDGISLPNLFGEEPTTSNPNEFLKPKTGLAFAGDSSVNLINDTTFASVGRASINTDNPVKLTSIDSTDFSAVGGVAAISKSTGGSGGLAGSYVENDVNTDTESFISDSTVDSSSVSLISQTTGSVTGVSAGGSGSWSEFNGASGSLAGSVSLNKIMPYTYSYISNSSVDSKGKIDVESKNNLGITSAAGSLSSSKVSAGAAIAIDSIGGYTESYLYEDKNVSSDSLTVNSDNTNSIRDISVGWSGSDIGTLIAAASVSLNNVDMESAAYVDSAYVRTSGDVSISSSSLPTVTVVAGSGSSTSEGTGVGASFAYNKMKDEVYSHIEDSSVDTHSNLTVNSRLSGKQTMVSVSASTSKVGLSGNAIVNDMENDIEAYVNNSNIYTYGSFGLSSWYSMDTGIYGGVILASMGGNYTGVGGSATVNMMNDEIKSYISNSRVKASGHDSISVEGATGQKTVYGLAVLSNSRENVNVWTGTAQLTTSGKFGFAGAFSLDTFEDDTESYVSNSNINGDNSDADSNQTVNVDSSNESSISVKSGGVNFGSSLGAGVDVDIDVFKNNTHSYINKSVVNAVKSVNVKSDSVESLNSVVVGGALSQSGSIAGSIGIMDSLSSNGAYIEDSTVNSSGGIDVDAEDSVNVGDKKRKNSGMIIGSVSAGEGAGIGGSVAVSVIKNSTKAYIDGSDTDAPYSTDVKAMSNKTVRMYAANASVGEYAGIGGSVTVDYVATDTEAYVGNNSDVNSGSDSGTSQSVDLDSEDVNSLYDASGSLEAGEGAVGASVDVVTVHDTNAAYVLSNVNANHAVLIKAATTNSTRSYSFGLGAGMAGVVGSVSVTNIGSPLGDKEQSAVADTGETIDENIKDAEGEVNTGDGEANTSVSSATEDLYLGREFDDDTPVSDTTEAYIGSGASVSTQNVNLSSEESSSLSTYSGGEGVGVVGIDGSVGIQRDFGTSISYIGQGATVSAGDVLIDSGSHLYSNLFTYGGTGGAVGLGAAVSYLYAGNDACSYIDGSANVDGFYFLRLGSNTTTSLNTVAAGANVGGAVAGAVVSYVSVSDKSLSYLGDGFTADASGSTDKGFNSISIEASSDDSISSKALPADAGAVSAQAAVSTVDYNPTVKAYAGKKSNINIPGMLTINSSDTYNVLSESDGINIGGYAAGASVATVNINPEVYSFINDSASVQAGSLDISASDYSSDSSQNKPSHAEAKSVSAVGATLLGVNGGVSTVNHSGSVEAYIGSGGSVDLSGSLLISSKTDTEDYSSSSGLSAGLLAIGANVAESKYNSNVESYVGSNTSIRAGDVTIQSESEEFNHSYALAGSGGVVSGNASVAKTSSGGTTESYLGDGSSVVSPGTVNISSLGEIKFYSIANSINASCLGASGALSQDTVSGDHSEVNIGNNVTINSQKTFITSQTKLNKEQVDYNSNEGSGGVYNGAASFSGTDVSDTGSHVTIGNDTDIVSTGAYMGDNSVGVNISAENSFYFYQKAQLNAGGLIASALSKSELNATDNVGASVTINNDSTINSMGDVNISANTDSSGEVHADASTWGVATVGQGKSNMSVEAHDGIYMRTGSSVTAFKNVNLLAGATSDGNGEISTKALTNVFNKAPLAYSGSPDADALSEKYSTVEIDEGASVSSGRDINIVSTKGFLSAYGFGKATDASRKALEKLADLFGAKADGSLDTLAGNGVNEGSGTVLINGDVKTGIYRHVSLTFDSGFDPGYHTVTFNDSEKAVLNSIVLTPDGYVAEDDSGYVKSLSDYYSESKGVSFSILNGVRIADSIDKEIQRLENIKSLYGSGDSNLSESIDSTIQALENEEEDKATQQMTDIIRVNPIFASSGNINITGDVLYGSGTLDAPGDVWVHIENHSPLPIQIGTITIPREFGGHILFNGIFVTSDSDIRSAESVFISGKPVNFTVETAVNTPAPSIEIESDFQTTTEDVNGVSVTTYSPPIILGQIQQNSDGTYGIASSGDSSISNLSGSVTVDNEYGSIFSSEAITANKLRLTAGGEFIFNNPNGICEIGPAPSSQFYNLEQDVLNGNTKNIANDYKEDLSRYLHDPSYKLAGNSIFINADIVNIDGIIQSGIADRSFYINKQMIDAAEESYAKQGMVMPRYITLSKGVYFDSKDSEVLDGNIKAVFDTREGKIILSNVDVSGGSVFISGKIVSTNTAGRINVMDGFGKISIKNETKYPIVIKGISNRGVDGSVVIIDKARGNGCGYHLATEYKFERTAGGDEVVEYTNKGIKSPHPDKEAEVFSGDSGTYSPSPGLMYFWMDGVNKTTQTDTVYYHEYDKFLGFIPVGERHFTKSDIISQHTKELDKEELPEGDYVGSKSIIDNYEDEVLDSNKNPLYAFNEKDVTLSNKKVFQKDSSGTKWYWKHGWILTRKTWIKREVITQKGTDEFYYNANKADYPIRIHFIGYKTGNVDITSKADVILKGGIANPDGKVSITSTDGNVIESSLSPVQGSIITVASHNVGSESNPLRVMGSVSKNGIHNPEVTVSCDGNVYLSAVGTGINVSDIVANGDVSITSDKNILSEGGYVKGNSIYLYAKDGSITTGNQQNPYLVVDTDANDGGKLTMISTKGNIYVEEKTGDLRIYQIKASGDVYVDVPDGTIIDGNPNKKVDVRTKEELLSLWNGMELMGGSAEEKNEQQIKSYEQSMDIAYQNYWRDYRHLKANPDGTYSYSPYDPNVRFTLTKTQIEALKESGWTETQIQDYENDMTNKYREWGEESYNPNFQYKVTSDELQSLSSGHSWTENELESPIPSFVFNKNTTSTVYEIEEPNIVAGGNVTLAAGKSIGIDKNDITYNYSDPGSVSEEEKQKVELALASAERNDIEWEPSKDILIIHQRDDVNVDADGWVKATAGDHIYLGSNQNVHVNVISSGNRVRLKVKNSILPGSGEEGLISAPNGLIMEAEQGSIGKGDSPLYISIGENYPLVARAEDGIYLDKPQGSLYIDNIYTPSSVILNVPSGGVYDWLEDTESNITAGNIDIYASYNIGEKGGADKALDVDLIGESGGLTLDGSGVVNVFSEHPLRIENIGVRGELSLMGLSDLSIGGEVYANSIDIETDGSITARSHRKVSISASGDIYLNSKYGSVSLYDPVISQNGWVSINSGGSTLIKSAISGNDIYLNASGSLTQDASLRSGGLVKIEAASYSGAGNISADGSVFVSSTSGGVYISGSITSQGVMLHSSANTTLSDSTKIHASRSVQIKSAGSIYDGSDMVSSGSVSINSGANTTINGTILSRDGLSVESHNNISIEENISDHDYIDIEAGGNVGVSANITSGGNLNIDSSGSFHQNVGTFMDASGNLSMRVGKLAAISNANANGVSVYSGGLYLNGNLYSLHTVTLTSKGAVRVNGNVVSGSDASIEADGNMLRTKDSIKSGGGIFVEAASFKQLPGTSINSSIIKLTTTGGDASISMLNAGNYGSVIVNSSGRILDADLGSIVTDEDIVAQNSLLKARFGIGSAVPNGDIDINSPNISAQTDSGGIHIDTNNALHIGYMVAGSGDLYLKTYTGNINVGFIEAKDGGIYLDAVNGYITDGSSTDIIATSDSTLIAGGLLGSVSNPLNVSVVGGNLSVAAGEKDVHGVSVEINGVVSPSHVLHIINKPPGLVLLNDHKMGGNNIEEVYRSTSTASEVVNPQVSLASFISTAGNTNGAVLGTNTQKQIVTGVGSSSSLSAAMSSRRSAETGNDTDRKRKKRR